MKGFKNDSDIMVARPPHYQSETGLEVIDVIEAFTFDLKGIEATDTGNVIKYICRWKGKNGLQDLKKARWYLEHLIEHVEKLEEENKPVEQEQLSIPLDPVIITDHGPDVLMNAICGCGECLAGWTTRDCEDRCDKYHFCDNIAVAFDILKKVKGE